MSSCNLPYGLSILSHYSFACRDLYFCHCCRQRRQLQDPRLERPHWPGFCNLESIFLITVSSCSAHHAHGTIFRIRLYVKSAHVYILGIREKGRSSMLDAACQAIVLKKLLAPPPQKKKKKTKGKFQSGNGETRAGRMEREKEGGRRGEERRNGLNQ